MRALRDGVVEAARLLGDEGVPAALSFTCAEIADARGTAWGPRGPEDVRLALAPWRDPGAEEHLGAVHESLLAGRKEAGAFYTPAFLVEHLLEEALVPLLSPGERVRVLDPACGTGAFLVPAARRIAQGTGLPLADAVTCVHGVDLDPVAVDIARFLLWLEAPSVPRSVLDAHVVVGNGLELPPDASYDVVVGNPPFLNQLRTATTREAPIEGVGPYTDTSAVFLLRSAGLVRDGGRVGLVQPLSVLAARDAAPVRAALDRDGGLVSLWASDRPVFDGTPVLTCAPVWERGRAGSGEEWSARAAPAFGIPAVNAVDRPRRARRPRTLHRRLPRPVLRAGAVRARGDLGRRGTGPGGAGDHGPDRAGGVPVGADADPVRQAEVRRAGRRPRRVAGRRRRWRRGPSRGLVPKVLVATQGAVLEGVVDVDGAWLPSVPTLVCTPPPDRLWHVLAVLLAPPVVALAAARYLGTGLSARSVKLSAKQLAALPLPVDRAAWDRGAELARAAQWAESSDERVGLLLSCAEEMCDGVRRRPRRDLGLVGEASTVDVIRSGTSVRKWRYEETPCDGRGDAGGPRGDVDVMHV